MEIIWIAISFAAPLVSTPIIMGLLGTRINKKTFVIMVVSSLTAIITIFFITGTFDTRNLAVGIITSAIIAVYST